MRKELVKAEVRGDFRSLRRREASYVKVVSAMTMTLDQSISAVDRLDDHEFKLLFEHINRRQKQEWARSFDEVVEALRDGLTQEELDEMTAAMNAEYIDTR